MKSIFVVLVFSPFFAIAQKSLSLTGKITGLKESTPLSLTNYYNTADTVAKGFAGKEGTVTLKATMKGAMLLAFAVGNERIDIFLGNSKVTISGNANDLKNSKVTGSLTHTVYEDYQKKFKPLFDKLSSINQQIQMGGRRDSLEPAFENTRKETVKEIDLFIKKYNSSPVSGYLLTVTNNLSEDIFATEKRLKSLKPEAVNNMYVDYLKQMINESKFLAVGSEAIDFTQTDTLGIPVSLSSFRGKYVLLDFWASWCGPCRQENPNLVQNFNKFKDKKFTVLGVSLDGPGQKARWLQAIHADNLTWTHVSDLQQWSNAVAVQYKVQSIPQNFLIGPDGKIVAKNLRGPALESKLCELLGCN
jgi:peroxiredoxin